MRRLSLGIALCLSLSATIAAVACGARTGLDAPGEDPVPQPDAGTDADALPPLPDALTDVREDVREDALPECTEDVLYIYVVTSENQLWAYKPETQAFELRGTLDCFANGSNPFSMAVARTGIAHVVYSDGVLFRVSTADASCEITPFEIGQEGFTLFGMGYAPNVDDDGETLYVAEISFSDPSQGLGSIDTESYALSYIGPFSENPGNAIELTPTGDGPLWGYFLNNDGNGGTLVQIDTATAEIVQSIPLPVGNQSSALAVAWYGGAFYIFTTVNGATTVSRYDPETGSSVPAGSLGQIVVGAGVSTCAPATL